LNYITNYPNFILIFGHIGPLNTVFLEYELHILITTYYVSYKSLMH